MENNYLYSFSLPILFLFPFLFSYTFIAPKSTVATNLNVYRNKAVSLEDEISGIEDAAKVADLREIKNIIKDKNKNQENSTSSKKENTNDIVNTKSTIRVIMLGFHQVRETKLTDGPKTRMFITKPEIFEKEMKFLSDKGYHTITTTDYINYLKTGKTSLNLNKSVILTFDDGYASQYTNALPILKKYNFTGTFFIYSDCVNKYPVCLTKEEIKGLVASGMKIGNHTVHHAYLPKYNDETIKNEIGVNKKILEDMVGTSSIENIFAYPYGATDSRVENIVKSFNYDGASGVLSSKKSEDKDIFNLKRYLLGDNYDLFVSLFK